MLPTIQQVEVAYLARMKRLKDPRPDSLCIMLGGDERVADRSVRTMLTVLHDVFQRLNRSIDVGHFSSHESPPVWVDHLQIRPVYRRQPAKPSARLPGYTSYN